jgi:hypothetical protein
MPRARRPALHSAETSFRGKGAAACVPTPTVPGWGFFMRAASRTVWDRPSSLPVGEEEERGKQAVVPPAALPPSILCIHLTRDVSHVCWGFSTACRRASTRGSSRTGRLPFLGVWSKRPEWRRACAALYAPHGSAMWQRIHIPVRSSGGVSRQVGR